jgi:nucleoside-diphosphate-sugar epimerase
LLQIDDAARAAVAALRIAEADPILVIADDRPVTRGEYYSRMAALLGTQAPRFASREHRNPEATRDATNKRVANRRMKAQLVRDLRYPDITTGLPAAVLPGRRA